MNKPDGLTIIKPSKIEAFLDELPSRSSLVLERSPLRKCKIWASFNGRDLKQFAMPELINHFGKSGKYYYEVCRGIDHREVSPSRIRKSISVERTFEENIYDQQGASQGFE